MVVQARIADRYEIKELLGEGGMGMVYRALDIKTKSDVALKTMRDASDPAAVEMFEKEWALLAGLSHPNIVDIRDVGEIDENGQKKPFFVMPLLRGATLSRLIEESSARLTTERVVGIIVQVCRGLQLAHDHGLTHRDIKPSNIFVMEDDTAKIIDFGVVHLAGTHSMTGHKGTWQYMAPEQVDLKSASPASDLFSIGVVCYETLTGKKPFARPTPVETAEAIRKYIPPPACDLNPAVSQLVSMVIHKAMAKEPMHRFVNARDLGETLQKAFLNQRIERFDPVRIQPRIERAKKALSEGDEAFAAEILTGLEAEGNIGLAITLLRGQIEQRTKQKRIRQLLESARTRVEQDELPLALEKIQEILSIDPENSDALALRSNIEKQRNERQIESWMELARTHLDRHDFSEARQALREVLRIRPSDTRAGDLLAETDRREQQSLRIRNEREQLYGSAMRAYQNGEMSSALSKLERLLELGGQTPDAAVPERDAAYQIFYNQVRTERDSVQNGYEAVRRHLADKAFARALEICDEFSSKYPNDALFQALKLQSIEQQRQEQSAYIAEIGRRVDAEPDLDRKVNILKEACERYPAEQQFQQLLKITRERRDLTLSIVAKARQYEERNQFAEALGQWDILRNLYPRYPGIDIELAQLTKRREAQVKDESKARLVESIDRALDSHDFPRALDLAVGAVAENPHDAEFAGLERRAREGLERSGQARALLLEGQQLIEECRFDEAGEVLRRASGYDPKSTLIRDTLLRSLVEQARPLVDQDWRKAEPLVQQACELDASHPGARSLRVLLLDAKRKEYVPQCLAEARDLQEAGNPEAALEKIESALNQYPNDARLAQFRTTLQNSLRETRRVEERQQDVETLLKLRQEAETGTVRDDWKSILERSQSIRIKYPDDPKVGAVASEIQQRADVAGAGIGPSVPPDPVAAPTSDTRTSVRVRIRDSLVAFKGRITNRVAKAASAFSRFQVQRPSTGTGSGILPRLRLLLRSRWAPMALILSIAVVVIVLALLPKGSRLPPPPPPSTTLRVHLKVVPEDAVVTVDRRVRSGQLDLDSRVSYDLRAAKLGYLEYRKMRQPAAVWDIQLEAAPLHVNLVTAEKAGEVFIDNVKKADLNDGTAQDLLVSPDTTEHTLAVKKGPAEILSITFTAEPGREPVVKQIKARDLQAVSSLGPAATLYNSMQGLKANLTGQTPQAIPTEGLKLGLSDQYHELAFDNKDLTNVPVPIENFPVLTVALHPKPQGSIKIACNADGAQLFIDGRERGQCRNGFWVVVRQPGDYKLKIVAPGFRDYEQKITLAQGENPAVTPTLEPLSTSATLEIQDGTPQATVSIDGESKGLIEDSGSLTIDGITPGKHKILIHRGGWEDSPMELEFAARQKQTISGDRAKLRQFGWLAISVTPPAATISYRLANGDSKTSGNGRIPVRAGRYRVEAKLDGYYSKEDDLEVEPGKEAAVTWSLVRIPDPIRKQPPRIVLKDLEAFDDRSRKQLSSENSWLVLKNSGYVFLKDGFPHVTIAFPSIGKGSMFRKKRIVWVAHYVDTGNRVEYEYDGSEVTRRVYVNQAENKKAHGQFKLSVNTNFLIVMDVRRDGISILDDKGEELDKLTLEGQDLTMGKIGLKGSIDYFSVQARQ